MISIEPQVLPHLLKNQYFADGSELVSLGAFHSSAHVIEMNGVHVVVTFTFCLKGSGRLCCFSVRGVPRAERSGHG